MNLKGQWRPLWSPPPGEALRDWLICGEFLLPSNEEETADQQPSVSFANDFLQGHGGEACIRPEAGQTHARVDGSKATWTQLTTSDTITFSRTPAQHPGSDVTWYAYTLERRNTPGTAILSLDSNCAVKCWLNGVLVHERFLAEAAHHNDQLTVELHAGENALLLKLVQRDAGGNFTLRMLEPATALALEMTNPRFAPSISNSESNDGHLVIITDDQFGMPQRVPLPVLVQVVAPGGRLMASETAARGTTVQIATADWPDGPYEISLGMTAPNGRTITRYLLWYHGDAAMTLQELLATVPPAADHTPDGMTHAMLAELVLDRLGKDAATLNPQRLPDIYPQLMEYAELQLTDQQHPHGGLVRLAYRDEIDDAPQFCRVYLPDGYTPAKRYPLIVSLHGRDPNFPPYINWGGNDQRHDELADRYQVIVAYPHARGNTWYRVMGDRDVMRCLDMIEQRFSVDDDRVYLMGYSMGGAGTWYVGSRHPERFAAIAPFFGGYDFRFQLDDKVLSTLTPREQYRQERLSYIGQAEALRTTPVLASHGDNDTTVPIDYSRYTVHMLERWGYDIRYWEFPGKGHGGLDNDDAVVSWLLTHTRMTNPRHVSVRSADLRYAAAHWVQITQRDHPYAFMQADAEIIAPNVIRLDTDNVLEITLSPHPPLIDATHPLHILWNTVALPPVTLTDGSITLRARGYVPATRIKRPGIAGPVNDLYNTPFAIVVGTISPDPLMRRMCERAGQRMVAWWDERFHCKPRYCTDSEITADEQARYSLLLIGGPAENLVAQALSDRIPLKITGNAITIDGHAFVARDAAVQMIYPNPLNSDRYVVVRGANSPTGMFFSDYLLNDVDFCIVDRNATDISKMANFFDGITGRNAGPPIVAGYFNHAWRYQDDNIERWPKANSTSATYWKVPKYPSLAAVTTHQVMLADVVESQAEGTFLDMLRDSSLSGSAIRLGGKRYAYGLSVAPSYWLAKQPCAVEYDLANGNWQHLRATIGLEMMSGKPAGTDAETKIEFIVKGDGVELYRSHPFSAVTSPAKIDVDITGVKVLRLEVNYQSCGTNAVKAVDWADLRVER